MDLTPLRPTASFLSSKARQQERISRSVTRSSTWIGASTLAATERGLGWTDLLRLPLIQWFALLSYNFPRLFVVLLHAILPENPNKAPSCYSAWILAGRPPLRAHEGPRVRLRRWRTSILLFGPLFARGAGSGNQDLGWERVEKLGFARGAYG